MSSELRDPRTGQFVEGVSGNPAGRPKGSRNKLGEAFIQDLYSDWQEHGREVLEAARLDKPTDYLKVIASVLPREIKLGLETMSDHALSARIDQMAEQMGLKLVSVGTAEPRGDQTIDLLPSARKN